jgi:hypothetical protein
MPEIIIREEGTGARTRGLKNVGGMLRVYNPATGAEVMNVEAHGARHQAGGADEINLQAMRAEGSPAYIRLIDTTSGGAERRLASRGGHAQILDANGNLVMDIEAHGSRHSRGGADPINFGTALALFLKSASPTLGTSGTLGAASTISPDPGYYAIVPLGISITIGGTLASGETITVVITFNLDNKTTTSVTKQYTATGTNYLADADFFSLWANGVHITSISVQAASSAATTSAKVTVSVRGIQH